MDSVILRKVAAGKSRYPKKKIARAMEKTLGLMEEKKSKKIKKEKQERECELRHEFREKKYE